MQFLLLSRALLCTVIGIAHSGQVYAQQWPYNLPAHQKYFPEHEPLMRRQEEAQSRMASQAPIGIRKMSDDPGEMFFLDYWQFEHDPRHEEASELDATAFRSAEEDLHMSRRWLQDMDYKNESSSSPLLPPLQLHTDEQTSSFFNLRHIPRNIFNKRNFQCPSGTNDCSSIGDSNICCATSETCVKIQDTGLGPVGCCPKGQKCGGSVSKCNTSAGYTSCPGSSNGGCCIPHFSCEDIGCVAGGTSTTTQVAVVTNSGSPTTSPSSLSPVTTTETVVNTHTTQPAGPSIVTVLTTESSSTTCTSGFNSCPASLNGGCCPTDRACGTGGECPPLTTTTKTIDSTTVAGIGPGVRPTSLSTTTSASRDVSTTTATEGGYCPTGFYMCSAYYVGGCCQVGRNCDTTSCPSSSVQTVVSNGETIVVAQTGGMTEQPVSSNDVTAADASTSTTTATSSVSTGAAAQGGCATGWYNCGNNDGGGCCPGGYACGSSCSATAGSGPSQVAKVAPSNHANTLDALGFWTLSFLGLVGGGLVWV